MSFAIDRLADQQLIGRITLRDLRGRSGTIGIYLHPDLYGRGYGTEAMQIVCPYLFQAYNLVTVRLDVATDNRRAIRCYEKAGFVPYSIVQRTGASYLIMTRGFYASG